MNEAFFTELQKEMEKSVTAFRKDLSKLRTLVNLHTLDLSHTPVSPKALETIAELPKLRERTLN